MTYSNNNDFYFLKQDPISEKGVKTSLKISRKILGKWNF